MSGRKCKQCGSSEIEEDPGRGDAVCMNCGSVLESNLIVSEVQFQESSNGTSSAIGQFVSSESKGGGCGNFGNSFYIGMGSESREITLKKSRQGISNLCNQLNLNQHYIDTACNFFKMALSRQLTRGRKNTHVYAACVYITCRTSGTSHLLIDISDALQICCYELGRTYLRLSKALCINIPSVDPCIYILRFANKLELGDKTHQVTTTALRLVQRMKRDSIHSGRRPSGLCGAALLMAARLHDFSRHPSDIVKIVKVHESTLRKRLFEFGDTPSSALTLEEFMTVDLEEEQDPPAFKAARKKDKERLTKIHDEGGFDQINELQLEIELMLQETKGRKSKKNVPNISSNNDADPDDPQFDLQKEQQDANVFITESTLGVIQNCYLNTTQGSTEPTEEMGPNLVTYGLASSRTSEANESQNEDETRLDNLDEDEIDSYLMTPDEAKYKDGVWTKVNATYLEEQKLKQEKLAKEKEEGKVEKKRKRYASKKRQMGPANSAGEAIEKMLQEKRLSSKINYEALKSLNIKNEVKTEPVVENVFAMPKTPPKKRKLSIDKRDEPTPKKVKEKTNPKIEEKKTVVIEEPTPSPVPEEEILDEDFEEEPATPTSEVGMFQMLKDYRGDGEMDEFGGFGEGYDEEEY